MAKIERRLTSKLDVMFNEYLVKIDPFLFEKGEDGEPILHSYNLDHRLLGEHIIEFLDTIGYHAMPEYNKKKGTWSSVLYFPGGLSRQVGFKTREEAVTTAILDANYTWHFYNK